MAHPGGFRIWLPHIYMHDYIYIFFGFLWTQNTASHRLTALPARRIFSRAQGPSSPAKRPASAGSPRTSPARRPASAGSLPASPRRPPATRQAAETGCSLPRRAASSHGLIESAAPVWCPVSLHICVSVCTCGLGVCARATFCFLMSVFLVCGRRVLLLCDVCCLFVCSFFYVHTCM